MDNGCRERSVLTDLYVSTITAVYDIDKCAGVARGDGIRTPQLLLTRPRGAKTNKDEGLDAGAGGAEPDPLTRTRRWTRPRVHSTLAWSR